jgi:hypothetical protein
MATAASAAGVHAGRPRARGPPSAAQLQAAQEAWSALSDEIRKAMPNDDQHGDDSDSDGGDGDAPATSTAVGAGAAAVAGRPAAAAPPPSSRSAPSLRAHWSLLRRLPPSAPMVFGAKHKRFQRPEGGRSCVNTKPVRPLRSSAANPSPFLLRCLPPPLSSPSSTSFPSDPHPTDTQQSV